MTQNGEATESEPDYAGDVSPNEAWDLLDREPDATLIDVRTTAEWSYVGLPDISSLDKEVVKLDWKQFPSMSVQPALRGRASSARARSRPDFIVPVPLRRTFQRCRHRHDPRRVPALLQHCRGVRRGSQRHQTSQHRRRMEVARASLGAGLTGCHP